MEQGFAVWNTWSAKGNKYPGEREILTQWSSFRQDKSTRVQIGSLFHLARQNGWVNPMPDAAALFSPTEVITPPALGSADLTTQPTWSLISVALTRSTSGTSEMSRFGGGVVRSADT